MAGAVTTDSSITCKDSGKLRLTGTARLTVDDHPVVAFEDLPKSAPYTGCDFGKESGAVKPCASTVVVSRGAASKLTVDGRPVLLDDLKATTDNYPPPAPPAVTVKAGQTKLTVGEL